MICVSVQEKDFTKCREILKSSPMVELRGDLCGFTAAQTAELVQMHPNLLYTHRIAGSSLETAYSCMVEAIKKGAKYIDIEIEAPVDYLEQIKSYARVNGCTLIISYHNFEGTQSLQELQTIYDICRRKGADIVKIVTTAHNISDASRVMQLYRYCKKDSELVVSNYMERGEESGSLSNSFGEEQARLLAFCMGKAGKFTRHLCLALGAPYTYTALDDASATAPGQFTREEVERLLCKDEYKFPTMRREETIFGEAMPALEIPCSKSIAQRAVLAAALAEGKTVLRNFEPCNDILGAVEVIKSLGAEVGLEGTTLTVNGCGAESLKEISSIFVGESGLLTRLLIPMAAYLSGGEKEIEIYGKGSILKRNLTESANAVEAAGAQCTTNGGLLPFKVSGGITENCIEFSGKESSQIVSGFLMMLPLQKNGSTLIITEPASIPYIDLTLRVLKSFGIIIHQERELPHKITYRIPGGQKYRPTEMYMDSDWSSAANFAVAGALTGGITLKNMPLDSSQADENIINLLQGFGYGIKAEAAGEFNDITIYPTLPDNPGGISGRREFSLHDCPDLFPIAAVMACMGEGDTVFEGVGRLAQKESNRAETVFSELTKLGFDIQIDGDKMYICGKGKSSCRNVGEPVLCNSHNDHRIAMALYIASLAGDIDIKVDNIKCIDKSFPTFLERLKK
ncbi:MAG: 3-phosphoshikimate 1-carboxyvinyltransferase [Bacteroidales bacterium]|nr:3-phosphoshikimate 1-carboxyvinyltransferase [Bacteroidales bacterium]